MAKEKPKWMQKAVKKPESLRGYFYRKYGEAAFDEKGRLKIDVVTKEYFDLEKKYEKRKDKRILKILRRIELYFRFIKYNPHLEKEEKKEMLKEIKEVKQKVKKMKKGKKKKHNPGNPGKEEMDIIDWISEKIYLFLKGLIKTLKEV